VSQEAANTKPFEVTRSISLIFAWLMPMPWFMFNFFCPALDMGKSVNFAMITTITSWLVVATISIRVQKKPDTFTATDRLILWTNYAVIVLLARAILVMFPSPLWAVELRRMLGL